MVGEAGGTPARAHRLPTAERQHIRMSLPGDTPQSFQGPWLPPLTQFFRVSNRPDVLDPLFDDVERDHGDDRPLRSRTNPG